MLKDLEMNQPEIVRLKNSINERDHAVGAKTAPVTLLEYGNFECIHCGRAYPVIKEIQRLLKNDLYFVFRHFPTVQTHPHALRAAEATEAAAVQGKFWEMHDELFTHQQALEDHDLSRYAKRIGLDVVCFEHDIAAESFSQASRADYQVALFNEHITGTLTLYVRQIPKDGSSSPNEPQVSEGSLAGTAVARTNRVRARQPLPR
jgi:uncharacterized protein YbaR (Trm112 family)